VEGHVFDRSGKWSTGRREGDEKAMEGVAHVRQGWHVFDRGMDGGFQGWLQPPMEGFGALHQNLGATFVAAQPGL
jgi:hypothetical protein